MELPSFQMLKPNLHLFIPDSYHSLNLRIRKFRFLYLTHQTSHFSHLHSHHLGQATNTLTQTTAVASSMVSPPPPSRQCCSPCCTHREPDNTGVRSSVSTAPDLSLLPSPPEGTLNFHKAVPDLTPAPLTAPSFHEKEKIPAGP